MLSFGIFITHGVACYVAIDITWNTYVVDKITNERYKLLWEYVMRTGIVLITCKNYGQTSCGCLQIIDFIRFLAVLLAEAIPNLGLYISLFGAFCLSTLGLALPALIEILVFAKTTTGAARTQLIIKNSLICMIGFFALIIGTTTSIAAIIQEIHKEI